MLAAEKESIGLFISAHPLKEVRAALRARVDCPLADLADRRDGDWVLVGGMITEIKKIRTKKGDPMMFATLDDLEGSVELLVFGNALAAAGEVLAPDSIVLVRGRVDHKDRDKTCIVAQQIEPFRAVRRRGERGRGAGGQAGRRHSERAPPAARCHRAGRVRARRSSRTCSPVSRATARW